MKTQLNLVFETIFTNDCEIDHVVRIMDMVPIALKQKGQPSHLKKEKINDTSRCRFDFALDDSCKSFSEFIIKTFTPMIDRLQELSLFVLNYGGEIRLTIYLGHIGRDFSLDIENQAKKILQIINANMYFDFSYADIEAL